MLEKGRSITTVNNALKVLKLILGYGIRVGYMDRMPFRVTMLKAQRTPRPTISINKVQEFFSVLDGEARNPQVPIILKVMIGLGLRESEALGMRWEWFDMDNRSYTVGKSKNRLSRVLPVPDWLWEILLGMERTQSEWLFPAEDGKPHRAQFCKKPLKRVCDKLGLGNVTQHRLRSSHASLHALVGTPLSEIQGLLGHKNIATTMIYVETSLEAKRHAQDVLSQSLGFA